MAATLRLPELAQRPMHTDEAVHAIRFGDLLETYTYEYDPFEYHGPLLLYLTLIPAWISGATSLKDVTEITLRLIPAVFGLGLVGLLFLFKNILDRRILLFAALFTAISPALVFYSRYYIMEILLVFFTLSAIVGGYRFIHSKHWGWALLTGASLGLMHTSKETCILAWGAMAIALFFTILWAKRDGHDITLARRHIGMAVVVTLLSAVAVSVVFFSSFFSYGRGVLDSILTYQTYITRGTGGFQDHLYPWYQYFKWLVWNTSAHAPFWTEGLVILLGLIGIGLFGILLNRHKTTSHRGLLRFIAIYTIVLTLFYSVIPYKTPWSMLGFYHGFVVLAGVGAVMVLQWSLRKPLKTIVSLFLFLGILHVGVLSFSMNFNYDTDPSNPYVYAHTHEDIYNLVDAVDEITSYWPEGNDTYIEVVCAGSDYWPLPWYFREYTQVGYFSEFNYDLPAGKLIITTPSMESALLKKLYDIPPPGHRHMYIPHFPNGIWLRAGVPIELYVRKDVWDTWYRESP